MSLTKCVQQLLALPYIQKIDTVELNTNENTTIKYILQRILSFELSRLTTLGASACDDAGFSWKTSLEYTL